MLLGAIDKPRLIAQIIASNNIKTVKNNIYLSDINFCKYCLIICFILYTMEPLSGFEPETYALRKRRSTS